MQYYFHPDHLGSSSYITDDKGKVVEHLEYFPFGETFVHQQKSINATPYRFTGKELDEDTGLYYFGQRYYDPRTSVWQSPDPILNEYISGQTNGGVYNPKNLSLFSYTYNNPVNLVDPDGNNPALAIVAIGHILIYFATPDGIVERVHNNMTRSLAIKPNDSKSTVAGKTLIKAASLTVSGGTSGAVAEVKGATRAGVTVSKIHNIQEINPKDIQFSQSSVNGVSSIANSMKTQGWKGAPIDIVSLKNGSLVTIDNTRVLASSRANINVKARVHKYNDKLPANLVERFTTKAATPRTWGEAVQYRIQKQNALFREQYPNGSYTTGAKE